MEPVKPVTMPIDGLIVVPVDVKVMVGNVVTNYIAGNRRVAARVDIDPARLIEWLTNSAGSTDRWEATSDPPSMDIKARLDELTPDYMKHLIASLWRNPKPLTDYGVDLQLALLGQPNLWEAEYVASPALGYARPLMRPKPPTGLAEGFKGVRPYTQVPVPCSSWNLAIGFLCAWSDLTRWSAALLPAQNSIALTGGHEAREKPFGTLMAQEAQVKALWQLGTLYMMQGSLLIAHANRRISEEAARIRMGIDVRSRPALLAREENTKLLYGVRMHPLVSAVAHALQGGAIDTYHGTKEALWVYGTLREREADPKAETAAAEAKADIGSALVSDAMNEFGRKTGDRWGDCAKADGNRDPISVGTLSRQALSLGPYYQGWTNTASQLGWTDVTITIGTLNQLAADFILCDGEWYSREPGAGLLGLSPVLSLGNQKVGGFGRRWQVDFGIGHDSQGENDRGTAPIEYSVLAVNGYQAATGDDSAFERLYIPAGMSMGEADARPLTPEIIVNDPLLGGVIRHWQGRTTSAGYVDEFYREPAGEDKGFKRTDWDGYSVATEQGTANASLAAGYVGQMKSVIGGRLLYKDRFFHRFPVRRSRGDAISFFSPMGTYLYDLKQDGNVSFNGNLNLPHAAGDLQKIVDSAVPVAASAQIILPSTSDQVASE